MTDYRNLWVLLIVLAVASPLGLYLPWLLKAGSAWGEWGVDEVKRMIGYAPAGMEKTADTWKAPMPNYRLPGQENAPLSRLSISYILSALIGMAGCGSAAYALARWLRRSKT